MLWDLGFGMQDSIWDLPITVCDTAVVSRKTWVYNSVCLSVSCVCLSVYAGWLGRRKKLFWDVCSWDGRLLRSQSKMAFIIHWRRTNTTGTALVIIVPVFILVVLAVVATANTGDLLWCALCCVEYLRYLVWDDVVLSFSFVQLFIYI